jgi:hypothetical protein
MDPDRREEGISRRKMLKRIGAGATIVWSAPVLTSIRTPAFATSPARCPTCSPFCGGENPRCEDPGDDPCACVQRHEGGCECVQTDFLEECKSCLSDADCEPDQFCVDVIPPCLSCPEGGPTSICWGRCPFS